jgi:signal peptidase
MLAVLAAWFVFLRPESLGGSTAYLLVRGTSMLPTYETGELVVMRAQDHYAIGDVVAYHVPAGEVGEGHLVIHRIVGNQDGRWIMQGDNNKSIDPWMPATSDIAGAAWVEVPAIGRFLAAARQPAVLGALASAFAVMAMLWRRPARRARAGPAS